MVPLISTLMVGRLSISNLFDEIKRHAAASNIVNGKLMNDYEQCIVKASRGTSSDEDAEIRVQIMSFLDIMRDEYKASSPNAV